MKIKINLLPPLRKEEIKNRKKTHLAIKIGMSALFSLAVFCAFLFLCEAIIRIQNSAIQEEITALNNNKNYKYINEYKNLIDQKHQQVSRLEKDLDAQNYYWRYFEELNNIIPASISLTEASFEESELILKGFSPTREDLLSFKEEIEKNEFFSNVEAPISNFTSSVNINFEFKMNFEKIK